MGQPLELDNVIRLKKEKEKKYYEKSVLDEGKTVIVNTNKGTVLKKKPFFRFGRKLKEYWVSNRKRAVSGTERPVDDFPSAAAIVIKVKYEVRCEEGNEEKVALALHKGHTNPGNVLNALIQKMIVDFVDEKREKKVNPVMDYYKYKDELQQYLREKLLKEVGLTAELNLTLKYEEETELKEYEIHADYFPVHVKDFDDELTLRFDTALGINQRHKISAILNYTRRRELEAVLREQSKKYILENVTLHDFVYNLENGVRKKLTEVLNKVLTEQGREIAWIKLETNLEDKFPPKMLKIHYKIGCDIKDYSGEIDIEHKLLLELEDIGKYRMENISEDLEEWLKEKLKGVTNSVLFDQRYVDILLDFEQENEDRRKILQEILREMKRITHSIGYTVKHLISDPRVEPLQLKRDGFMVEDKETAYATHDNRVDIKLGIVATGKITDLGKIAKYLTPEASLKDEMIKVIKQEAQREMHDVHPEEFYMASKANDEMAVEERLKLGIEEKLKDVFFAEGVNVIIKILETELINRICKLIDGSPYSSEITVLPLLSGGHREKVKFHVEFLIKNVIPSKWQIFLLRKKKPIEEEIKAIEETLKNDITSNFQKIPADVLLTSNIEESNKLLGVARLSLPKIADVFGLDVSISLLSRKATIIEETSQELLEKHVKAQFEKDAKVIDINNEAELKNLEFLQEKRRELLHPDSLDDDEKEEIEKNIKEIAAKSAHSIDRGKSLLKPPSTRSKSDWSFDRFTVESGDENNGQTKPPDDKSQKKLDGGDREK